MYKNIAVMNPPPKKQIKASQLLTASCSVPLIPWPLVHPPAILAPKPIKKPPHIAPLNRTIMFDPKAVFHSAGIVSSSKVSDKREDEKAPSIMPLMSITSQSILGSYIW